MRVAVISDTHDLLRPEVLEQIRRSDAVIHAGDISSRKIVDQMRSAMKHPDALYLVRGNADEKWVTPEDDIPLTRSFELEKVKIFLVHNRKHLPGDLGQSQMVIFGHSHKYFAQEQDGRFWLNPGCCGRRRFDQEISLALLGIENGNWDLEKIVLAEQKKKDAAGTAVSQADVQKEELSSGEMLTEITEILNRMNRGQSMTKIAKDLSLEEHFVEEICRISVTHPGVDANGILDKIEVNRRKY